MSIRALLTTLPFVIDERLKDQVYRDYVTTALMMLTETTADRYGGRKITISYSDMISRKAEDQEEDERSGDEIAKSVIDKICGKEE